MENKIRNPHQRPARKTGIITGIILILLGVLLISINIGLMPTGLNKVIISWQMIFVVIGLVQLFKARFFAGSVFLLFGTFFIIPRLAKVFPETFSAVPINFISLYWPVLLVVLGIVLILYWIFKPKKTYSSFHHRNHRKYRVTSGFSKNSVFGDGEHIFLDEVFKGGEVNAVFGGATLDLRKTTLPEGETILEVNAVFGGVTVLIPTNWYVEINADSVFGGFRDLRTIMEPVDKSRKLIIEGGCVFGSGEIRN